MHSHTNDLPVRTPRVDVFESDREVLVVADLPGVSREALRVEVEGDVLTLGGAVGSIGTGENATAPYRFERHIRLRTPVDLNNVRAELGDGQVRVFVARAALSRRVAIA